MDTDGNELGVNIKTDSIRFQDLNLYTLITLNDYLRTVSSVKNIDRKRSGDTSDEGRPHFFLFIISLHILQDKC
jgi:hypothetical protein